MSAKTGGIPRYRASAWPVLFRQGFRPFFLGAGLWAALAVAGWVAILLGYVDLPTAFGLIAWHAHEMIFGYVAAVVAGFLLTAIPNWTGRMPLQGAPLAALFCAWLIGRAAVAVSGVIGAGLAALLDLAFLLLLFAAVLREIAAGRNWRNLPMPVALALLVTANALMHAGPLGLGDDGGLGLRLAIAVLVGLIGLIGGRIVPSFTRNWLHKRGETRLPAPFGRYDRACLAVLALSLALWVALPDLPWVGAGLILSAALWLGRVARWRGHLTLAEPLVWSLHLGILWVPVGLLLIGLAPLWAAVPPSAGLHALTAGAMGSMTLAVMTRATLGHTGRALEADAPTAVLYGLVSLAAAARVAAALDPAHVLPLIWFAAAAWCAAFVLFAAVYGRRLAVA